MIMNLVRSTDTKGKTLDLQTSHEFRITVFLKLTKCKYNYSAIYHFRVKYFKTF